MLAAMKQAQAVPHRIDGPHALQHGVRIVRLGLPAATDAAAGAGHDLDKVVVRLPGVDAPQQLARVADAAGHRHPDLRWSQTRGLLANKVTNVVQKR